MLIHCAMFGREPCTLLLIIIISSYHFHYTSNVIAFVYLLPCWRSFSFRLSCTLWPVCSQMQLTLIFSWLICSAAATWKPSAASLSIWSSSQWSFQFVRTCALPMTWAADWPESIEEFSGSCVVTDRQATCTIMAIELTLFFSRCRLQATRSSRRHWEHTDVPSNQWAPLTHSHDQFSNHRK